MAYGLKYYAEIQNFRRQLTRVEIYQRDYSSDVLQIGDVCGLVLEVQGGQDDVYAPIVKTQARLSMISSDDKPTADGIKYGGWGEFFTPDDTLYKVVILTKATPSASSWTARWSGYITPDSWQEGLEYRTAVTITARDNIGHLQDFEFDMAGDTYGLVSIKDLVEAAMDKIHLAMTFAWSAADGALAGPIYLTNAKVVATNFKGKDWFSVLDGVLESIGYTIRFTDYNTITCAPIRHLPLLGYDEEQDMPNPLDLDFFGGTGSQVPAVKSITDTHDYDYSGDVYLPVVGSPTLGTAQNYSAKMEPNKAYQPSHMPSLVAENAIMNKVTGSGDTVWQTGSDLVNAAALDPSHTHYPDLDKYVLLAANGDSDSIRTQTIAFDTRATGLTIRFGFAPHPVGYFHDSGTNTDYFTEIIGTLAKVRYVVRYEKNNVTRYWDGAGWVDTQTEIEKEFDVEYEYATELVIDLLPCDELGPGGKMYVTFDGIWYQYWHYLTETGWLGFYMPLLSLSVTPNTNNLQRSIVRTVNNEKYNIMLERQPMLSPLSVDNTPFAVPANYGTALYYYPELGAEPMAFPFMLNWDTVQTSVVKPLPVFIHQQILCYRGANLWELDGECAPKENGLFWFNCLLEYKNRTYILQSGTLDFFTGKVEGAILREFLNYDDIWDDTTPATPGEPGAWDSTPSYPGSGSSASSSAAGYNTGGGGGKNFFEEDGEGGVKLKDEYNGLWAAGFMAGGGIGESSGGGGIDLDRVWESLTNNTDKPNVKINAAHIPIASASAVGGIKVGSGLSIAADGTLSATGGATGTVTGVKVGTNGSTISPDSNGVVTIPYYNLSAQGVLTIGNVSITPLVGVPYAQNNVTGGFRTGFTESDRNYALKVNSSNYQGYVTVPWTNTTYKLQVNGSWNGDSSGGTSLGTIYAPTTTGTQGYVLAADSNGKPAWTDLSGVYLPLSGGTLTGSLRLKPTSTNYGLTLNFGNSSYAYISNDSNRHLSIYAQYGISISTGSDSYPVTVGNAVTFNGSVTLNSEKTLTLGSGVLKWDAINSAWHLEGNFYADGFITAGGIGSTNTLLVTLEGTQTISGAKTFSADTTFSRIGVGTAPNSSYAIYASGSQYLSGGLTVGGTATITTGLGVGTAWTGGANKLVVSGSAIATAWNTSSDRRLKENILSIDRSDAIEKLMQLKPVTWTWNKKCGYDGKACAGFVAQDVQPVIPQMVNDGGKYLALDYTMLHAFEVAGIQSLVERVGVLERENAEMKKRLGL